MMLPLRNDGAGLTVRMKLNLPVGFPYCCGTLLIFFHIVIVLRATRAVPIYVRLCSRATMLTALAISRTGLHIYVRPASTNGALVDSRPQARLFWFISYTGVICEFSFISVRPWLHQHSAPVLVPCMCLLRPILSFSTASRPFATYGILSCRSLLLVYSRAST